MRTGSGAGGAPLVENLLHNRRADLLKVLLLVHGKPQHCGHQHSLVPGSRELAGLN